MSYPVYYVPAGDVLPIFFDSFDGGTGASITMTGLAVTDIEIYKDGSATQRSSDAGYTLLDTDGIDFDGVTGIHGFSIDTGDNTDAGFYTVGAWFHVVVSAVTIDGQTVNFVAAAFRLMAAESVAGKPKTDVDAFGGTAGTFSGGRPEVNTTHAAGTAWGSGAITAASIASDAFTAAKFAASSLNGKGDWNIGKTGYSLSAGTGLGNQTADITGNLSGSVGSVTGAVGSVTGAVGSVTGNVGGNVVGSVGSVTGAVGSVTGNVGGNVTGSVGSVATGGIVRASFAADTGLQTIRSNTAQAGGAATITLDASASGDADFYKSALVYLTGGTGAGQYGIVQSYDGTTKVATVHANWKTAPDNTSTFAIVPRGLADVHMLDGQTLTAAASITVGAYIGGTGAAALEATSQTILADTNELQADWANGGRLDVILDARASQTSVDTVDDFLDTEVAALTTELAKVPKSDSTVTWNATALASIQSEANDALVANHLDHLLAVDYDPASKPGVATALLNELIESDAGVSRYTANALEQAPAGGGGGSGDWTADEKTAIRTILGIPGSGTTPATPTDGALADILALLSAEAISHSPVISDSLIVVVEDDTYDGTLNAKIYWTTTTDYTGATIAFTVWRQNDDGSRTTMDTATGTVVSPTRVELATYTATMDSALQFDGLPAFEKLQFACVATLSAKEYTVAIGDFVVKERR